MSQRGDGKNEISIQFQNGSRIVGLPGKKDTVRGFSSMSLLPIDEASRLRDEVYRALRPMLAVGAGDLWLMSTPNRKRGFLYEEWTAGTEGWERISVPATECGRIKPKILAEENICASSRRWKGRCFRGSRLRRGWILSVCERSGRSVL